jgi:hypothetical protein
MISASRYFSIIIAAVFSLSFIVSVEGNVCIGRDYLQARDGTIKLKAGVIFKNGDVKPVARTAFVVLLKDLDSINAEAAKNQGIALDESFEYYVDNLMGVSAALKAWLKKHEIYKWESVFANYLTPDDLFDIPEFHDSLRGRTINGKYISFTPYKYPAPTGNKSKDEKAMQEYRKRIEKEMYQDRGYGGKIASDWVSSIMNNIMTIAYSVGYKKEMEKRRERVGYAGVLLARNYSIKEITTSLAGEAEVVLPSGVYWLSNLRPTPIGQSSVLWNLRVVVEPGKVTSIELSNDNAKEIK